MNIYEVEVNGTAIVTADDADVAEFIVKEDLENAVDNLEIVEVRELQQRSI